MSIESVFCLFLAFLFVSYSAIHLLVLRGLNGLLLHQRHYSNEKPRFSVIVAARNEETHIGTCLQSLVHQDYPKELFEIIIVDDRSTDETASIVLNYSMRYPSVRLVRITEPPRDLPPKKNALNEAIEKSNFEILAFTDADCIVPQQWLSCLAREFMTDVGLVAGYSPIEINFHSSARSRWGDAFLRYLEIKNSLGAAAGIGLGKAYLATGRNLAYRKRVFHEVGGFQEIKHSVSGDDDLFIQMVQRKTQWTIRYMVSPLSHVETKAPGSFSAFINQRKRHFSAGKYYPLRMKIIFLLIHLCNLSILVSVFLFPALGVLALAAKFGIDILVFSRGTAFLGGKKLMKSILPLELMSVLYNLIVGPLGLLGRFNWKGNRS